MRSSKFTFEPERDQISYIQYKLLVLIDNELELKPKHLQMIQQITNGTINPKNEVIAVKYMREEQSREIN